MLTSLSLTNFKSWKQIEAMRLAPITGLFGANSSGKTSVLQLLLLLKQTINSPDRRQVLHFGDSRSLVSLGTFQDVVYGREGTNRLIWNLQWTLPKPLKVAQPEDSEQAPLSGTEMAFTAEISRGATGSPVVESMSYRFVEHTFGMSRRRDAIGRYSLIANAPMSPSAIQLRRRRGRPTQLPPPVKYYRFPDQVRADYPNADFLSDFELALEELFNRLYYLGPLRDDPKPEYTWAGDQPEDVGRRGERAVDALLAARERRLVIKRGRGRGQVTRTLEEETAWWLRQLHLIHDFSVEAITEGSNLYQVWVQKTSDAPKVLLTNVGFGVSQILPVLVLCYSVPEGSTILLEQPEIHLHPSVQAGLADVFIDAIKLRKIQIILESHSEHLLLRLQRRIAEDSQGFVPNDAALYFCDLQHGASHLLSLDLDLYGNIRNWPADFFGNTFEEAAERTRAAMKRKRNEAA
jgi:predicted ATPase